MDNHLSQKSPSPGIGRGGTYLMDYKAGSGVYPTAYCLLPTAFHYGRTLMTAVPVRKPSVTTNTCCPTWRSSTRIVTVDSKKSCGKLPEGCGWSMSYAKPGEKKSRSCIPAGMVESTRKPRGTNTLFMVSM